MEKVRVDFRERDLVLIGTFHRTHVIWNLANCQDLRRKDEFIASAAVTDADYRGSVQVLYADT